MIEDAKKKRAEELAKKKQIEAEKKEKEEKKKKYEQGRQRDENQILKCQKTLGGKMNRAAMAKEKIENYERDIAEIKAKMSSIKDEFDSIDIEDPEERLKQKCWLTERLDRAEEELERAIDRRNNVTKDFLKHGDRVDKIAKNIIELKTKYTNKYGHKNIFL